MIHFGDRTVFPIIRGSVPDRSPFAIRPPTDSRKRKSRLSPAVPWRYCGPGRTGFERADVMGWAEYAAALAVFFLSHTVPLRPGVKSALVARIGRGRFSLGYSALSLAVLYWVLMAAGRAPYVPLWGWAAWQAHVTWLAMLAACLLAALAIGRPNPFSFGGRGGAGFDPARPGLIRYTRHPLLVALALWAGGHMVPNGDLAHVALFGLFAIFAISGRHIVDRRRRRVMGPDWTRLDAARRAVPLWPPRAASTGGTVTRLALGAAIYAALLALHPSVIGVSPLP